MIRRFLLRFGVLLLCVSISAGALLYVSAAVQEKQKRVRALEYQIEQEREALRVLRAEWAYLNSPQRLEYLSRNADALQMPGRENFAPAARGFEALPVLYAPKPVPKPSFSDEGRP